MKRPVPSLGAAEKQLIVNCARLELAGPRRDSTQALLREALDWNAIVLFAEAHSVGPLLHRHLQNLDGAVAIPLRAGRRLLQLTHRAEYRNRHYATALGELLDILAAARVPVIVLKGVSLVELIYRSPGLRPLIDLNLLVPPEQLETARAALIDHGYVETLSKDSDFYRWSHSQLFLVKREQFAVHVLLQWGVVTWPRMHAIDLPRFWQEAQPVCLAGRATLIPSWTDFVLYMSLQADKYGFMNASGLRLKDSAGFMFDEGTHNRLIRFTDLYELVRRQHQSVDWDVLTERARTSGLAGSVFSSLSWVGRLLDPVVDDAVLKSVRPPRPRGVRRLLGGALLGAWDDCVSKSGWRARVRRWWARKDALAQRRVVELLDLFEFIFPRVAELKGRNRRGWGATIFHYPVHAANGLLHCGRHFGPPIYWGLRARVGAFLRRE